MKNRSVLVTTGIMAVGAVLGLLILIGVKPAVKVEDHGGKKSKYEEGEQVHAEGQGAKGPHGGRMLAKGNFALEVTIFEQDVLPEFRVYAFDKGKPVDPAEVKLQVRLERLGAQPEVVGFHKVNDFLRSERVIVEPHSFKLSITAERQAQAYQWAYEQSQQAGAGTNTLAGNEHLFIPLKSPSKTRGVLAVRPERSRDLMIPEQRHQFEIFAALVATALERVHYVDVARDALLMARIQGGDLKLEFLPPDEEEVLP